MADQTRAEALRALPPVEALRARAEKLGGEPVPAELLLAFAREVVDEARAEIRAAGSDPSSGTVWRHREEWLEVLGQRLQERLLERGRQVLRPVINATGVLLHTNLGRAPLPAAAQRALVGAAAGYSNLEMDLAGGRRRSRLDPIRRLLPLVTGAEAGMAVHNNAAAVYLTLTALAAGGEVVVSRGHLVEIGGSFRLPEIMEASGARLREVGSTNRTRLDDYARALGPQTALLLAVHPSNFHLVGFTEDVPARELARLAADHQIPFVHDVGSGALRQHGELVRDEPRVQDVLEAGADLVCFSGDKLLGGPQAGILVGRQRWLERLSKHPVARVVRLDKAALAALESTLEAYLDPATVTARIPLLALLSRTEAELQSLAVALADRLLRAAPAGFLVEVVETVSEVGGGSLPGLTLPSRAVALTHPSRSPDAIARSLRLGHPAVAGRIEKDRFLLDVRALLSGQDEELAAAVAALDADWGAGS